MSLAFAGPATTQAASVTFNFDTLADGANNGLLQAYMQDRLNSSSLASMTVTVTGTIGPA